MKIISVVVTFNRKEKLVEAIDCLLQQSVKPNKIIIVDNGSSDGTEDALRDSGILNNSLVNYNKLSKNLGGAGGFSKGIELALEEGFDWISLSDDDAMMSPDFYEDMISGIKKYPDVKCFTGKVLYEDKEIQLGHRRRVRDWNLLKEENVASSEYVKDFEIDIFSFVGCFINQQIIKQIGLPRKEFFIWYDDIEYSLRIRKFTKIINLSNAIITHKTGNQRPAEQIKRVKKDWREYYGLRNSIFTRFEFSNSTLKAYLYTYAGFIKRIINLRKKAYSGTRSYYFHVYINAYHDGLTQKLGVNKNYLPKG